MDSHAERYYEEIRNRKSDVEAIANNSGFAVGDVNRVKQHIFIQKHDLGTDEPLRLTPDYDMAVSWQKLIDGKNIREMDIVLLKHELVEIEFLSQGYTFDEAHELAEKKYNYAEYVKELNAREGIV